MMSDVTISSHKPCAQTDGPASSGCLNLESQGLSHMLRVLRSSHDWTFDPRRVQLATAGPVAVQSLAWLATATAVATMVTTGHDCVYQVLTAREQRLAMPREPQLEAFPAKNYRA